MTIPLQNSIFNALNLTLALLYTEFKIATQLILITWEIGYFETNYVYIVICFPWSNQYWASPLFCLKLIHIGLETSAVFLLSRNFPDFQVSAPVWAITHHILAVDGTLQTSLHIKIYLLAKPSLFSRITTKICWFNGKNQVKIEKTGNYKWCEQEKHHYFDIALNKVSSPREKKTTLWGANENII